MPRFKDQAICLRLIDWSETSQIVALLTQEHGKVRGIAKGSKRMSPSSIARYSGGIELLTRGEIGGIIRPTSDLATLIEWDLQEPYHHLRTDLESQRLAYYAADLCNALLADHDQHAGSFAALSDFLSTLAHSGDSGGRDAALLGFQWRLLEDCGYRPELNSDIHTGEELPAELPANQAAYSFDARAGGFSVDTRGIASTDHRGPGPWRARRETLELLRRVAAEGNVPPSTNAASIARANRLLCVYARAIIDRELPTMALVLEGGAGESP